MLQIVQPIIDGQAKSFEVTDAATDDYNNWIQERINASVWNDCHSGYRWNNAGRNTSIFPGSLLLFWWKMRKPCWDHFITVGAIKERKESAVMKLVMVCFLAVLLAILYYLNAAAVLNFRFLK
jgi:hypothetical protein